MKNARLVSAVAVGAFVGLTFHATAMGFLPPDEALPMNSAESSVMEQLPKCATYEKTPGELCYITGGISVDEVSEFKALANSFLLEVVFVQKANMDDNIRIEEYLASVNLRIIDKDDNVVLDTTTDGPFFLADLAPGTYRIIVEHENVLKTDLLRIDGKKHIRKVFLWER